MKRYVLALCFLASAAAVAQPVDLINDSQNLSLEIYRANFRLTEADRKAISEKFQQVRRILYGVSEETDIGSQMTCVSRDNDGRDPYVLGIKDGVTVTRIQGTNSQSMTSCRAMLNGIRVIGERKILCVSKDNDSRDPYVLGVLSGSTLTKITPSATSTFAACQNTIGKLKRINATSYAYCASRDNDGRDPYIAVQLDVSNLKVKKGSESFRSMEECNSFL